MRIELTGSFELAAPSDRVMPLFTAEGERLWAPGWDPEWADVEHTHEPGEVWTTSGPPLTTWVTVDAGPDRVRYARVAPGDSAGTVAVACTAHTEGTTVTVSYDLTALSPNGETRLTAFEASYAEMLEHWRAFTSKQLGT
jgi:hypothetical protein